MNAFRPVLLVLLAASAASAATSATLPATRRSTLAPLDLTKWTQRDVDVIAAAAQSALDNPQRRSEFDTAAGFSIQFNPAIADDDTRMAEVAAIVDRVNATTRPADAATWMTTFAKMPRDERRLRQILRRWTNDKGEFEPLVDAGNSYDLATHLDGIPERDYDRLAAPMLDDLDAQCRAIGKWDGLELVYSTVAFDALRRGNAPRANRYIDRMLTLLRKHADFQDPRRGNTDGVTPANVALLLHRAGRDDEAATWLRRLDAAARRQVADGMIGDAVANERLDDARRLIAAELPAEDARRLTDLLDAAPSATTPTTDVATAPTASLAQAIATTAGSMDAASKIACYHAWHGRIELAIEQFAASRGPGRTPDFYEFARLAKLAGLGGHADAARRGFDDVLARYARENTSIDEPHEIAEKSWFVRRFAELGEYDTAARWLNTSTPPDASARLQLAVIYRRRGDLESARANLRQVVELGDKQYSKEGGAMAAAAVELNELGDAAEAERVLLASLSHIRGEDFGFGGTADVIRAARRMNRLDLLDRLYERGEFGERLLLSLSASSRAWYEANDPAAVADEDR